MNSGTLRTDRSLETRSARGDRGRADGEAPRPGTCGPTPEPNPERSADAREAVDGRRLAALEERRQARTEMIRPPRSPMFSPRVNSPDADCRAPVGRGLRHELGGAILELAQVLVGPPVLEHSVAVALGSLVVKPVAHLVADDGPDAAVVDRLVRLQVEEGGWRIAAGKTISFMGGCSRRSRSGGS